MAFFHASGILHANENQFPAHNVFFFFMFMKQMRKYKYFCTVYRINALNAN